ncbi:hypothetical protein Avbf_18680 [Armadillidium vulgare]|nr:hypothetical protein Avbf_18680 [Armadillidium vulgare]
MGKKGLPFNILSKDLKIVSRLQYKFDPRVGVIVEDLKGFPNQTQIKEIICLTNFSVSEKLTFQLTYAKNINIKTIYN